MPQLTHRWIHSVPNITFLAFAWLITILTSGCDPIAEPAAEPEPKPPGLDASLLDHPSRSDDDRYRDTGFKPVEVYEFFGMKSGMTVADLWPGRGYNMQAMSHLLGEESRVLGILGPLYTGSDYEQRTRDALQERIDAGGLTNVEVIGPTSDVPDSTIDVMVTVRNYHDLGEVEKDRTAPLSELLRILKPGGILGVVDAHTDKPGIDESVHRINGDLVIEEITSHGFELISTSDLLANPEDTYDFDGREDDAPVHRYFIDRFVHKYRKPTS